MRSPVSFSSLRTSASGRNRLSLSSFARLFPLGIFALSSLVSVQAQTETILHSFEGTTDGEFPTSGLVGDGQSNLYGGASGDTNPGTGAGIAFKIDPAETFSVLHTFTAGPDGFLDVSGLTLDSQGNLYGTAFDAVAARQELLGGCTLSMASGIARLDTMYRSVRPIGLAMVEQRMDPQSTVFPAQPCRP